MSQHYFLFSAKWTYLPVRFVENNMTGKQLIDLGYVGINAKKTIAKLWKV